MDQIYHHLKQFGKVKLNEPLAKHTTFKIGGPADYFIVVEEREKLVELLNYLSGEGIDYFILGGGSNLLISDEGMRAAVIQLKFGRIEFTREKEAEAEAGALLSQLVNMAAAEGLSGLGWAAGIPGTIGGAARGNTGAMGYHTAGAIAKVEVWRDGEVLVLDRQDCEFGYRDSAFKHNRDVILRVWLVFKKADKGELAKEIQYNISCRTNQPKGYSAGCFFKNINLPNWPGNVNELPEIFKKRGTVPVGWLMEQVGMKGKKKGDAQVGVEHGNFIVNLGKAKANDVLALVEEIKIKVYDMFGVELEEEVEIV
ncbi:MAG: UDP-N-acetylmuramate dehydrogenase [Patescibacteria group bacterium]